MKEEDRNKRIKNELKNKFQNKNVNILFMPDEFHGRMNFKNL